MPDPMRRTVVIGGGAAGIAAARRLHDAGREVLLLEASDRLGGRAHSVPLSLPRHPGERGGDASFSPGQEKRDSRVRDSDEVVVDLGCGWLHSARRNPWTRIAEAQHVAIDRHSPNWDVQWRDLGFPPADQRAFGQAWDRWATAAHAALGDPDRPLSAFIAADDPWRPMIDSISGYANGAPLDAVSLHDWAAYEDAATDDNWALPGGYGTLIAGHAGDVSVRLSTVVRRIDHGGAVLRIETGDGTLEAGRAIVCVPTTAIADGALAFHPMLSDKRAAAADLPLGLADKTFLLVDRPEWPAHAHLTGNPRSPCTASHRLSPFGWPVTPANAGAPLLLQRTDEGQETAFAGMIPRESDSTPT